MISRIVGLLEKSSRRQLVLWSAVLITVIGFLDYWSGPEISSAIFYLLPVALTAYCSHRHVATLAAFYSAFVWLLTDVVSGNEYSSYWVLLWNSGSRLLIFLIVAKAIHYIWTQERYYRQLAHIDELTGVLNRRGLLGRTQEELLRARRFGREFSIAYIDVDDFKQVNDRFGHDSGDALLKKIAAVLREKVRATDFVGRLGGDEFAVLFVETGQPEVKHVMQKCFAALNLLNGRDGWPVSFSVGVVTYRDFSVEVSDLIGRADGWMYKVKQNGKNNVVYGYDSVAESEAV